MNDIIENFKTDFIVYFVSSTFLSRSKSRRQPSIRSLAEAARSQVVVEFAWI